MQTHASLLIRCCMRHDAASSSKYLIVTYQILLYLYRVILEYIISYDYFSEVITGIIEYPIFFFIILLTFAHVHQHPLYLHLKMIYQILYYILSSALQFFSFIFIFTSFMISSLTSFFHCGDITSNFRPTSNIYIYIYIHHLRDPHHS
jgi:hypothetical protein